MAACISTQLQACNGGTTPIPQSRNENALAPLSSCAGTNVPAQPVTQGTLRGVTAFSNTSAFAVGFRLSTSGIGLRTLIEQFNGTTWSIVSTPNPGANSDQVDGAGGSAPNDVWAVGSQRLVTNGQAQTLILHYNGSTWSVVASPTQLSMIGGALLAVAARSTSDAWAAGRYTRSDNTSHLLVEHWNGVGWSIAPVAHPVTTGDDFNGAAPIPGTANAWAVGDMILSNGASTPLTETLHC